jgi:hypothetical protein
MVEMVEMVEEVELVKKNLRLRLRRRRYIHTLPTCSTLLTFLWLPKLSSDTEAILA